MRKILTVLPAAVAAVAISFAGAAPASAATPPQPAQQASTQTASTTSGFWFDTQSYFANWTVCNDWGAKFAMHYPHLYDNWQCSLNVDGSWQLWLHHV
ncbi:hypothetical protein GCM10022225_68620 [Plantactinospora mayteni]|uniref:Chitinase n=1 Tax=Plantactinospora mayteni TaxID=566021 RepID=A0ABQ4F0Y7_9ACTN|nr:hypothetical protein [Plantactinospora mayteni]GIH00555.1 hypothetical protein Pma05_71270 [Plantactinospora mayteni]